MMSFMLTASIIGYDCSTKMHLTAMMSYDLGKRIQVLCVHNLTCMRISSVFTLLYAHDVMVVYNIARCASKCYFGFSIR